METDLEVDVKPECATKKPNLYVHQDVDMDTDVDADTGTDLDLD